MIYKFSNSEISVSTANTVYDCQLVRITNPTTAVVNCTVSINSSVNAYSFSVLGNTEIIVQKATTYRVQGTGLVASPIAFLY